jgi:hypothetical protein
VNPGNCSICGGDGYGNWRINGHYHAECEPTVCTCGRFAPFLNRTPDPDGIGECRNCHRLVLAEHLPVEQEAVA